MNELKPCPFCGEEADTAYNTQFNFQVFCTNDECFMNTITMYDMATEEEAIEAWNRRVNGDVVERKKGKWIKEPNCWYRCSHCGSHYPSIKDTMEYNYCPDCGADMREKEKTDGNS